MDRSLYSHWNSTLTRCYKAIYLAKFRAHPHNQRKMVLIQNSNLIFSKSYFLKHRLVLKHYDLATFFQHKVINICQKNCEIEKTGQGRAMHLLPSSLSESCDFGHPNVRPLWHGIDQSSFCPPANWSRGGVQRLLMLSTINSSR